jgi:hypothetical protein
MTAPTPLPTADIGNESLFRILFGGPAQATGLQTLTPQQQQLFSLLGSALMGGQTQGPFGGAIQHLAGLAGGDPAAMQAFEAPLMRQFQEQTVPDLAARFGGMGSGGALGGTGFRTAALQEATNLQERIAALRAQMQSGAIGQLSGLFGQFAQPQFQPAMTQPETGLIPGMGAGFARAFGQSLGGS